MSDREQGSKGARVEMKSHIDTMTSMTSMAQQPKDATGTRSEAAKAIGGFPAANASR
jgi:hypothetical protein